MKKLVSNLILKLTGWKAINNIRDKNLKKFIIVGAPHTSNWDGLYSICAVNSWGIRFKFLIKKDLFFFPLGIFLKGIGGLPVDRKKKTSITTQAAQYFKENKHLVIGITPEATRSYNENWKKGFHFISTNANVPVVLAYIDYVKKQVVLDQTFDLTEDPINDIKRLKEYFSTKGNAKYPDKFAV